MRCPELDPNDAIRDRRDPVELTGYFPTVVRGPARALEDRMVSRPVATGVLLLGMSAFPAALPDPYCGTPAPSAALLDMPTDHAPAVTGGTIDVYFHVIIGADGQGDVSDSVIASQIAALNAAFAPTGWQFALAAVDRTVNDQWFRMTPGSRAERFAKEALRQGSAEDLNVYTGGLTASGLLGWSTFPDGYATNPDWDGVVLYYGSLPGGGAPPYNEGDTGTHQVGHWMGLVHTFQGACAGNSGGTPPQRLPSIACDTARDTCPGGGFDPIANFMDYTPDACRTGFSAGQNSRMDTLFSAFRYMK